jgi:hypothetical protein
MKSKEELKQFFENGDIPKQEEFWEWQDSYWHKNEKIPADKLDYDLKKKADLVDGKVPASQLPSYVDDVLEFDSFESLPHPGEKSNIYIVTSNNTQFRWSGSEYIQLNSDKFLMTTNTDQTITGRKEFITKPGNTWDKNSLIVLGTNGSKAGMTFYSQGMDIGQMNFDGYFNFKDANDTTFKYIKGNGFIKENSNDDWLLTGGGGHTPKSQFSLDNHTHQFLYNINTGIVDTHNLLEDYKFKFNPRVESASPNVFPTVNNANAIISMGTHGGRYGNLLGVNGNGDWFSKNVVAGTYQPLWKQFAYRDWVTDNFWGKYSFGTFNALKTNKPLGILTDTDQGQKILSGGIYTGDDYSEQNKVPNLGIYSKGLINGSKGIAKITNNGYGNNNIRTNPTNFSFWGNPTGAIVIELPANLSYQGEIDLSIVNGQWYALFQKLTIHTYESRGYSKVLLTNDTGDPDVITKFRIGESGGKSYLILNDIDTVWSYPNINVDRYLGGHKTLADGDWVSYMVTDLSFLASMTELTIIKSVNKNWVDQQGYLKDNALAYTHKINPAAGLTNASDTNTNRSWFDYNWAGSGASGSVINFSGFGGANQKYSTELFGGYSYEGNRFGLRTKNGDTNTWNPIKWIWHDGNFNPSQYILQSSLNTQLTKYAALAGAQTFTNTNIFSQSPIVPNGTLGTHAINLNQLNTKITNYDSVLGLAFGSGSASGVPYFIHTNGTFVPIATQAWINANFPNQKLKGEIIDPAPAFAVKNEFTTVILTDKHSGAPIELIEELIPEAFISIINVSKNAVELTRDGKTIDRIYEHETSEYYITKEHRLIKKGNYRETVILI